MSKLLFKISGIEVGRVIPNPPCWAANLLRDGFTSRRRVRDNPSYLLNFWLYAVFACSLMCAPAFAQTPNPTGEIIAAEGKVEWADRPDHWQPAAVGRKLRVGDGIRTGEFSRATLRLPAGSVLRLDELTTLRVQESLTSGKRTSAVIARGGVFFFSRTSPEELDFATPVATGAIKGTEVLIRVQENGASSFVVLDGAVELTANQAGGASSFVSGEKADVQTDGRVTRTAVLDAVAPVQWALYYPAVLDPAVAEPVAGSPWRDAWIAYQRGALPAAIRARPEATPPQTDAERLLAAALSLAAGRFELAEIRTLENEPARALRVLAAVASRGANAPEAKTFSPTTATGWLAVSYARQSAADLPGAVAAARSAATLAPASGYAWARVGELEFAAGRRAAAEAALATALKNAPDLASARALRGFVAAADGRRAEADALFAEALALDPAFAPARLGVGILAYGRGEAERGRRELIAAAALDPVQSLPRSYLAKAWLDSGNLDRAAAELVLAARLDAGDPTPALYSALLAERQNQPNAAITALERSVALNDNRRVYRSRLLLDEDRAVRRANLAAIYESAGAREIAFREASRSVRNDPANFSAHLFLANAYDQLRDPLRVNLRYETPWSGSLLLARLLAPANAGAIAPSVGLGEYTALFEPQRFTLQGETVVFDDGEWRQTLSHTGNLGDTNYALDVKAHRFPGKSRNQDFARDEVTAQVAHQLTPDDTVVATAYYENTRGGDLRVGVPPGLEDLERRFHDKQLPILTTGYRHHWRPGSDTLVMAARLEDESGQDNPRSEIPLLFEEANGHYTRLGFDLNDRAKGVGDYNRVKVATASSNRFALYHLEISHLEQGENFSLQAGARFQRGTFEARNRVRELSTYNGVTLAADPTDTAADETFQRKSVYGYATWKFARSWSALAGASGDWVEYPVNLFTIPLTAGTGQRSRISPKVGLVWEPNERWSLRAAHAESIGGLTFEESFRLEPVQFAGFTQGVRSLIPEAVGANSAAPKFDVDGLGATLKWAGRFYLDIEGTERRSETPQAQGIFAFTQLVRAAPRLIQSQLGLRERQLSVNAFWIITPQWSVTTGFDWLDTRHEQIFPLLAAYDIIQRSRLFAPKARVSWNSPKGFFAQAEATWFRQREEIPTFAFARNRWNTDLTVGYRAPSLKWTASTGVVNLWNQDLALGALTVPRPLPLQRAFFGRITWSY